MIGTHQPRHGQISLMRHPMSFEKARATKPITLTRRNGTEMNCYWVDENHLKFLNGLDWAWLCKEVMLFISSPQLNRLLTVRTEWSKK